MNDFFSHVDTDEMDFNELVQFKEILTKKNERTKRKFQRERVSYFEQHHRLNPKHCDTKLMNLTTFILHKNEFKGKPLTEIQRKNAETILNCFKESEKLDELLEQFYKEQEPQILHAIMKKEQQQENIKNFMENFLAN